MSLLPCLEVLSPGMLTTVQDAGRREYAALGLPPAGAADPISLRVANLLAGNAPDAAALEITIAGPELQVLSTCAVALAGADLGARLDGEIRLTPGACYLLRAGSTLSFGQSSGGARAYLALAGGIAAPLVLGSAATYLAGGIGGLDGSGRPLRQGDKLTPALFVDPVMRAGRIWPRPLPISNTVRVIPGPHAAYFAPDALDALCATSWVIADRSDRMGLRLAGTPIKRESGELLSQGVVRGAIQVPPDGQPIVLLADHQTTGGYPVLGVVATADWPILGQLAPGAALRFSPISREAAQALLREQAREIALAAAELARDGDAAWLDLAAWAGAYEAAEED